MTDPEQCSAAVEATVRAFGQLQLLVNNVGLGDMASVVDTPTDDFDRTAAWPVVDGGLDVPM